MPNPYNPEDDEIKIESITIDNARAGELLSSSVVEDLHSLLHDTPGWTLAENEAEMDRIFNAAMILYDRYIAMNVAEAERVSPGLIASLTPDRPIRSHLLVACLHTAIIWERG